MGAPLEMTANTNGVTHVNGNGTARTNGNGTLHSSSSEFRMKVDRKISSPMAPPFMVSAPGKVIVFGEHSVVHGKVGSCARALEDMYEYDETRC